MWVIILRTVRWARYVARLGQWNGFTGVLRKQLRKRDYMENLGADWRIILKRILKIHVGRT
jgi:hypothetical protein